MTERGSQFFFVSVEQKNREREEMCLKCLAGFRVFGLWSRFVGSIVVVIVVS